MVKIDIKLKRYGIFDTLRHSITPPSDTCLQISTTVEQLRQTLTDFPLVGRGMRAICGDMCREVSLFDGFFRIPSTSGVLCRRSSDCVGFYRNRYLSWSFDQHPSLSTFLVTNLGAFDNIPQILYWFAILRQILSLLAQLMSNSSKPCRIFSYQGTILLLFVTWCRGLTPSDRGCRILVTICRIIGKFD